MDDCKKPKMDDGAIAVGQAACGVVHDISNVMQSIMLRAEVAMSVGVIPPETEAKLEQIITDVQNCAILLKSVLEHARKNVEARDPISSIELMTRLHTVFATQPGIFPAIAVNIPQKDAIVHCDDEQVEQMLTIVLCELGRETDQKTAITVDFVNSADGEDKNVPEGWVMLSIKRTGQGQGVEFEEGRLPILSDVNLDQKTLDMFRVRGIVRQHRGILKISEAVSDEYQELLIHFSWPGLIR